MEPELLLLLRSSKGGAMPTGGCVGSWLSSNRAASLLIRPRITNHRRLGT